MPLTFAAQIAPRNQVVWQLALDGQSVGVLERKQKAATF
jgi:hypothetical protein